VREGEKERGKVQKQGNWGKRVRGRGEVRERGRGKGGGGHVGEGNEGKRRCWGRRSRKAMGTE
jgi:hypothetical protein